MDSEPKEVELKLRVSPEDMAVLRAHPSFSGFLSKPVSEQVISVYFDSDTLFLREHGLTLRVRHNGKKRIQTIKSSPHGIFERSEWEHDVEGDQPNLALVADTALGPILTDDIRNNLKPVFETRIERTSYRLNGGGNDIALAFDKGRIVATNASYAVCEIELELNRGDPMELFKIARAIGELVPSQLDVKSKSERGYDLVEKSPATEKAYEPELGKGTNAGRAFTLIARACLRHLVENEGATERRNAEALHQMRIALRRLRAAISLFSTLVTDDRVEPIKAELKWLGRELAPARDLDSFLIEALRPLRKQQADEPGLISISRMFARERLKSYRRARDAVESARFRALVLDTAEWIETGPWSTSDDPLMVARRAMPIETLAAATQKENPAPRRGDRRAQPRAIAPTPYSDQENTICGRIFRQHLPRQENREAMREIPLGAQAIAELPRRLQRHHDAQSALRRYPSPPGTQPDRGTKPPSRICRGSHHGRSAGTDRAIARSGGEGAFALR